MGKYSGKLFLNLLIIFFYFLDKIFILLNTNLFNIQKICNRLIFSKNRRHPDLNWGMGDLQSPALPLGYTAFVCFEPFSLVKI